MLYVWCISTRLMGAPPFHTPKNDAAAEYEKASRPDLAEKERNEANILHVFAPPLLSEAEIDRVLHEAISGVDPAHTGKRALGQVFKAFYAKVDRSSVDPQLVEKRANALLSAAS